MEKTLEFDPAFAFTRSRMGLAYEGAGDYDRAVREYRRAHELSGRGPLASASLGYALGVSGAHTEARVLLDELVALSATRYVSAASIADICLGLGEYDSAIEWLERAVEERANAHRRNPGQPPVQPATWRAPLRAPRPAGLAGARSSRPIEPSAITMPVARVRIRRMSAGRSILRDRAGTWR